MINSIDMRSDGAASNERSQRIKKSSAFAILVPIFVALGILGASVLERYLTNRSTL